MGSKSSKSEGPPIPEGSFSSSGVTVRSHRRVRAGTLGIVDSTTGIQRYGVYPRVDESNVHSLHSIVANLEHCNRNNNRKMPTLGHYSIWEAPLARSRALS